MNTTYEISKRNIKFQMTNPSLSPSIMSLVTISSMSSKSITIESLSSTLLSNWTYNNKILLKFTLDQRENVTLLFTYNYQKFNQLNKSIIQIRDSTQIQLSQQSFVFYVLINSLKNILYNPAFVKPYIMRVYQTLFSCITQMLWNLQFLTFSKNQEVNNAFKRSIAFLNSRFHVLVSWHSLFQFLSFSKTVFGHWHSYRDLCNK